MQGPVHGYDGGNVVHGHMQAAHMQAANMHGGRMQTAHGVDYMRSATTSALLEEMLEPTASPADCVAGSLHMGCMGSLNETLNDRFEVN